MTKKRKPEPFKLDVNEKEHPILFNHMKKGTIKIINDEFIGIASDGIEVNHGFNSDSVERYLKWAPKPNQW